MWRARWHRPLAAAMVTLGLSCSTIPDSQQDPTLPISSPPGTPTGADPATFRTSVNAVFERRCGSLDCHGTLSRGMRIYGTKGLRIPNDAGLLPGAGATSQDEINANYASIIGVQPEAMNAFLAKSPRTAADAYQLVILSKPLELEKHKGGPALSKGEPAEQCITTWLLGSDLDESRCALGSKAP